MPANLGDTRKSRATLKSYFVRSAVPTANQFEQLIDSGLNLQDDGVFKPAGDPLSIAAVGDETGLAKTISLYNNSADAKPAWTIALRPRGMPGVPFSARAGFGVLDGDDNCRLTIDRETGNVGIGLPRPEQKLHVQGSIRAWDMVIGPWAASPLRYMAIGSARLDQTKPGNYALSFGTDAEPGDTFLNSPTRLLLRVNNEDKLVVTGTNISLVPSGNVGVNTLAPTRAKMHIEGDLYVSGRIGSLKQGPEASAKGWQGGLHTFDIEAEGAIWSKGPLQNFQRDLAEIYFSADALEPGDVVSLGAERDSVVAAAGPGDRHALGVVSTNPGVLLGSLHNRDDLPRDGRTGHPVALVGCVPCKVTDEGGPIARGDLLTSAPRRGHAMRAGEAAAAGTIIAKALEPHAAGHGVIEVFVMLR